MKKYKSIEAFAVVLKGDEDVGIDIFYFEDAAWEFMNSERDSSVATVIPVKITQRIKRATKKR